MGGGKQQLIKDVRNCKRCMIDNKTMADFIFGRVKKFLPDVWMGRYIKFIYVRCPFFLCVCVCTVRRCELNGWGDCFVCVEKA